MEQTGHGSNIKTFISAQEDVFSLVITTVKQEDFNLQDTS